MNIYVMLLCAGLLTACSQPGTRLDSGSPGAALAIMGAPPGAILLVDGVAAGVAARYDGVTGTLGLQAGVHQLEVRDPGVGTIYRSDVYIGSGETRTVKLSSGTK
jgi:hypothetical protein